MGWQVQPSGTTVQGTIEGALRQLNSNQKVEVIGCGRTDRGVHASMYIAHADLPFQLPLCQLMAKLNAMLPSAIAVHAIYPVPSNAHARFDATDRTYHYFIHTEKDPFVQEVSWFRRGQLDIHRMNTACLSLLTHTNFECFSKVKTAVRHFHCTVTHALWIRSAKGYIFTITANRFLRNMVRAAVGTLIEVGTGKMTVEQFQSVLRSNDRSAAGTSVPAKGLFLAKVRYPYALGNAKVP